MKWKNYALALWLLTPLAGCASLNDARYEHTQKARARSAWRCLPDQAKKHCYPKDYEQGWKDGFYDVATGGKGCPPVVAPQKYWRPEQILEDCDNRRHAYYDGFQDGVACASRYPDTHHLKLWSSCECPLPACENQCQPGITCPSGGCGFTAFPDSTQEGFVVPMPEYVPMQEAFPAPAVPAPPAPAPPAPAPAVPTPEVVPPAPKPEAVAPKKSDSVKTTIDPATGFDVESVRGQIDQLKLKNLVRGNAGSDPGSSVATVGGPISDTVWLEMESELLVDAEQFFIPSASDSAAMLENSKSGIAALAKPFALPTATVAPIKAVPQDTRTKADALKQPGMIEQSTVEMASPIVAPDWGVTAKPVVRMASDLELRTK